MLKGLNRFMLLMVLVLVFMLVRRNDNNYVSHIFYFLRLATQLNLNKIHEKDHKKSAGTGKPLHQLTLKKNRCCELTSNI